jgi:hypothetical protein
LPHTSIDAGISSDCGSQCGLFPQSDETGLLKMMVPGQRLRDSASLHDLKRNAIRQRPLFVRRPRIQVNSVGEKLIVAPDNFRVWVNLSIVRRRKELRPAQWRLRQRIGQFGQSPRRRHHQSAKRMREGHRPRVARIVSIHQGEKSIGVRKNGPHRLGVPWM